MQTQLSTSVLERFMAPEDFKKFIEEYRKNVSGHGLNRFITLSRPVTEKERDLLRFYFTERKSVTVLEKELHMPLGTFQSKISRIATQIVYQHMKELGI